MPDAKQSFVGDLVAAFMLLSRLPCGWYEFSSKTPPQIGPAGWAFPVVGMAIGGIGGAIMWGINIISQMDGHTNGYTNGMSDFIAATAALVVMTMLTGAMHEDGLADLADGFGGGHTIDDKIRIMHDSQIGSYGVIALILSSFLRVGLLVSLAAQPFSALAFIAVISLILAGTRWQILMLLHLFPISENAKLAQLTRPPSALQLAVATSLWLFPFAVLFTPIAAVIVGVTALLSAVLVGRLAMRHIAGLSGDVMGASVIVSEIALMLVILVGIGGAPAVFGTAL